MKKLLFVLTLVTLITSCTENQRARNWGGTENVTLKPNEVLLNATWKETNLWILTRDTTTGITHFREKSEHGLIEGEIVFN